MKNSSVRTSGKLQDASQPNKEPLQRQYDVLVLLIVVAVLSTLLAVIVLSVCVWLCYKIYIQPSFCNNARARRPKFRLQGGAFPPPQREMIQMEDFAGQLNSLLQQRNSPGFVQDRTSTSKDLGYKHTKNYAGPILTQPNQPSWTPSPNQQTGEIGIPETDHHQKPTHSRKYCTEHSRHCLRAPKAHGTNYMNLCPEDLGQRLAKLRNNERPLREHWNSEQFANFPRVPANTPSSTPFKSTYNPSTTETSEEERFKSMAQKRIGKRMYFGDNTNAISYVQSCPGPVAFEENDPTTSNTQNTRFQFPRPWQYSQSVFKRVGGIPKNSRVGSIQGTKTQVNIRQHNRQEPKRRQVPNLQLPNLQTKYVGNPKRKPDTPPVALFLHSPSTDNSADRVPVLNRNSKTYFKLYHVPDEEQVTETDAEGNSCTGDSSESTPSMSWDHLTTPEPSPTQVQPPNILLDQSKGTVVYIHDSTAKNEAFKKTNSEK